MVIKSFLTAAFLILFTFGSLFSNQVYLSWLNETTLDTEGYDILLNEDRAYIITGSELHSFSTSDPTKLNEIQFTDIGSVRSLAFTGRMGYILGMDNQIRVYDFTTTPPKLKTNIRTNGNIKKIVIDNGYLYILNIDAGLQVYDVNVGDFPVYKNTQILPSAVNGIFVKDRKAYVTGEFAHLSIIDASDISKLPIVGTYTNGVKFYEPYVDGNYAFVPQGNTGVQVLNISKLPFPSWVANLYARKSAKQVVSSNFYVWIADEKSIEGFFNKDAAFYFAGNYKEQAKINRIALIEGKYIYMVTGDSKLKVLKIEYKY